MTFAQDRPVEARAVLDRYCVTCHNDKLRTQGLTLQAIDLADVSAGAEVWEKVIRKLRTRAMPPPGRPRPDQATYDAVASWLEGEIDRVAGVRPNPGRTETFHRLNRAEYRNAVRDLLAIEIDVSSLLPADDAGYGGFDNNGGLKMSPTLLERYMAAARQISRVAVANPTLPPTADTFRLAADLSQDASFEDLPLGTRGGTSIRYNFPLDAEYVIEIEPLAGGTDTHQLEVSVDGERLEVFTIGGRQRPAPGQDLYEVAGATLKVRLPVKAGPRDVTVTFIKKTSALAETVREPFQAPHAEGGQRSQPYVGSVTITGPFESSGAAPVEGTPSRRRIFACRPAGSADEARCAREIFSTLARRAYRRPVTDGELRTLLTFYEEGRTSRGFDGGIEMALRRLLVSPEFLFRVVADPPDIQPNTAYRLSDLDLASRLAFFLWSSIPDDALLDLAEQGKLQDPGVREQQVRRMLADPRSQALAANFAGQWLQLRIVQGAIPDVYLFPNFGESFRRDFRRETELFFDSLLRENRSVLDLLTADYTFVNERLAKHYGIPNVYGSHFRRVKLTDENRYGLLGHASVLTVTSHPDRTSVVGRGKYILENILGAPPPPPPANVPPLQENKPGGRILSLRERMSAHRANPVCASCHARMDPLGFALENFDATGTWRTREGTTPIDASAALPDGTSFSGPAGLRAYLVSQPEQIATSVTEKLLIYALGRGVEHYDAPAVRQIVREAAQSEYSFHSLVLGIAKSTPFQMRRSAPAQGTVVGQ